MKKMLLLLVCVVACLATQAQMGNWSGLDVPEMRKVDTMVYNFMHNWNVDGGTVAIAKDGKLIYNRGFRYADQDSGEVTRPYHRFRLASVSKPITGIAIMKLIESGAVKLTDTVFGPGKIINEAYYTGAITDARIYNITIKQLLEHSAGWDRDINCSGQAGCDPISFPLHVTSTLGEPNPVADSALIKFLLKQGLNYVPGTKYAYSNIGYLVLAKVIERKTGMKYHEYVKQQLFDPIGVCDIELGKNLLADKLEREGEYNSNSTGLSCYGTGVQQPWQYGALNIEAMHAHGGWISSAADLVRLTLAVDGFATVPDILLPASINTMKTPGIDPGYAKGWSVNASNHWWHTGSLPGTATFLCRANNGYTWAILLNNRSSANNAFWNALDALPWNAIATISSVPTYNLFAPSNNTTAISATATSATTVNLNWTNGNGDGHIVVATEANALSDFPMDGTDYTANAAFGAGQVIGTNAFVVYNGTSATVPVTNLVPGKKYLFTIFEYSKNTNNGNNAIYKYGCRTSAVLTMPTGIENVSIADDISFVPNPSKDMVHIKTSTTTGKIAAIQVYDFAGKMIMNQSSANIEEMDISSFVPGVYSVKIITDKQYTCVKKLVKL